MVQKVSLAVVRLTNHFFCRQRDKRNSTFETLVISKPLRKYLLAPSILDAPQSWFDPIAYTSNKYLKHYFDLLGSGWVHVKYGVNKVSCAEKKGFLENSKNIVSATNKNESDKILSLVDSRYVLIDWQLDFKSGHQWSAKTWYRDIQINSNLGVDIKVPWELARMQHLTQLAFQYHITGQKEKYLREFRNQVLDFIATNPPRYGVNWCCTMDVGVRVSNWLVAYDLFSVYGAEFDDAFLKIFKRSIFEHGKHIKSNLEWYPHLRSNHYLANIVGLLFVAAYLPKSKETDEWLSFAVDELVKEVELQFNPDGSNFEASTSYHRLSGEMVVYAVLLVLSMPNQEQVFPDWFIERLQKIAEFTIDITRPDGLIPQVGDNDNGRFLKLFPIYKLVDGVYQEELLDHRHLVAAISTLFDSETFRGFAAPAIMESNLFKPKRLYQIKRTSTRNKYPGFGIYLFKTERVYMAVRCGSIGQNGYGGHAHNDQLSFELCVDGVPFIVDPGAFTYTASPESRNVFRATASHNTLGVEGKEQNIIDNGKLFRLGNNAHAEVIYRSQAEIHMRHKGFGSMHFREVRLDPLTSTINIYDKYDGGISEKVVVNFTLAPNALVEINEHEAKVSIQGVVIKLLASHGSWNLTKGLFSKSYGCVEKISKLQINGNGKEFECYFEVEIESEY